MQLMMLFSNLKTGLFLAKAKAPLSRNIVLFFPNVKTFPEYPISKKHMPKNRLFLLSNSQMLYLSG